MTVTDPFALPFIFDHALSFFFCSKFLIASLTFFVLTAAGLLVSLFIFVTVTFGILITVITALILVVILMAVKWVRNGYALNRWQEVVMGVLLLAILGVGLGVGLSGEEGAFWGFSLSWFVRTIRFDVCDVGVNG